MLEISEYFVLSRKITARWLFISSVSITHSVYELLLTEAENVLLRVTELPIMQHILSLLPTAIHKPGVPTYM